VFIALLSNAIGFSRQNGEVLFRVEHLTQGLIFTIKDEGPGISPEKRGQILEAFTSFSEGTGHRGMGLGLSLAQSLVKLHGGQLDFPEHSGIGTIVTVRFPHKES
jgi:signal transduction histidine kinase